MTSAEGGWARPAMALFLGALLGFIGGYFAAGGGRPAPRASATARVSESPGTGDRIAELSAALERDPESPKLWKALGNARYDREEWALAIEAYEKARREAPADADLLSDLGAAYRNGGAFRRAIHFFEAARETNPDHWQSLLNLTLLHAFDTGDAAAAERHLQELKRRFPEIPRLDRIEERISSLRAGV